jgi:hypothetical protein
MDLGETDCEDGQWIQVIQEHVYLGAFILTLLRLLFVIVGTCLLWDASEILLSFCDCTVLTGHKC